MTSTSCARCKTDLFSVLPDEYADGEDASWIKQSGYPDNVLDTIIPEAARVIEYKTANASNPGQSVNSLPLPIAILALALMGLGVFVILPVLGMELTLKGTIFALVLAGGIVLNQYKRIWPKRTDDVPISQTLATADCDDEGDGDTVVPAEKPWKWRCSVCRHVNASNALFCEQCAKLRRLPNMEDASGISVEGNSDQTLEKNPAAGVPLDEQTAATDRRTVQIDRSQMMTICPFCMTRQRSDRSVCDHCAAKFSDLQGSHKS